MDSNYFNQIGDFMDQTSTNLHGDFTIFDEKTTDFQPHQTPCHWQAVGSPFLCTTPLINCHDLTSPLDRAVWPVLSAGTTPALFPEDYRVVRPQHQKTSWHLLSAGTTPFLKAEEFYEMEDQHYFNVNESPFPTNSNDLSYNELAELTPIILQMSSIEHQSQLQGSQIISPIIPSNSLDFESPLPQSLPLTPGLDIQHQPQLSLLQSSLSSVPMTETNQIIDQGQSDNSWIPFSPYPQSVNTADNMMVLTHSPISYDICHGIDSDKSLLLASLHNYTSDTSAYSSAMTTPQNIHYIYPEIVAGVDPIPFVDSLNYPDNTSAIMNQKKAAINFPIPEHTISKVTGRLRNLGKPKYYGNSFYGDLQDIRTQDQTIALTTIKKRSGEKLADSRSSIKNPNDSNTPFYGDLQDIEMEVPIALPEMEKQSSSGNSAKEIDTPSELTVITTGTTPNNDETTSAAKNETTPQEEVGTSSNTSVPDEGLSALPGSPALTSTAQEIVGTSSNLIGSISDTTTAEARTKRPVPICPRPDQEKQETPSGAGAEETDLEPLRKRRRKSTGSASGQSSTGEDKERRFPCPLCNYRFARKWNRDEHKKTHDTNRQKDFACEFPGCTSTFTRKHDLKRHTGNVHVGEINFQCPACKKGFSRKDAWKRHLPLKLKKKYDVQITNLGKLLALAYLVLISALSKVFERSFLTIQYDKTKLFFDFETTIGPSIAVIEKIAKNSGSSRGFKSVLSRKKRKGIALDESVDVKVVSAKLSGGHSWGSETGDTIESKSVDMEEECLVEETSFNYSKNGALANGDPNQTPKNSKIKTKKALDKSLRIINYVTGSENNDVLNEFALLPPLLLIKSSVQISVCKSFALDIDFVSITVNSSWEKLGFIRKIFSGVNSFERVSTPSKFGRIICVTFTSEKVMINAANLANDCGVVVNTNLKHPVNNHMNRAIVLKEISVGTSVEAVWAAVSAFRKIKVIKMQLVDQADLLASEWSILSRKDAVQVARADINKQLALLYTLPIGTIAHDLWDFIGSVGGKTCFIDRNPASYSRVYCATVCFSSEMELVKTMAATPVIKGVGLHWFHLSLASCVVYRNFGHTSLSCRSVKDTVILGGKKTLLLTQNQLRLVKIYAKKSASISRSLTFSGKTWASVVGALLYVCCNAVNSQL
ncbi:hypothetical protein G9A89_015452 [Geosiphon pyriformis]|nr:hypothetical protein G9A89_015452 [Geosiphon pyriformis]